MSLVGVQSALAQAAATTPPASPAAQRQQDITGSEAKERAEDAALLQQLESTASATPGKNNNNNWTTRGPKPMTVFPATPGHHAQALFTRSPAVPKTLLVRTSNPEPKAQAGLEEDLAVMSHILHKSLEDLPGGQAHQMNALGVDLFFSPAVSPMRSLYLDNYGAVFFLSVGFPLVAPPDKTQEEKPARDSAWDDARQELYGQRFEGAWVGQPGEEYTQEKVEKLKEALINAIKNASNIRDLKPEEYVTVWVGGSANGGAGRFRVTKRNAPGPAAANVVVTDEAVVPSRRTMLTLRVSKADIDGYAKGKLDRGDFEKRVRITTYTGDSPVDAGEAMVVGGTAGRKGF
jgi:hypothetical protein